MKKINFLNYKILALITINLILSTNSFAKDFNVLSEEYGYTTFKHVFENGAEGSFFYNYNKLSITDVANDDVEATSIDMLCYRSDNGNRKAPHFGYAIVGAVQAKDLSRHFSSREQNLLLPQPLFYVVAATEVIHDIKGININSSPMEKYAKIPLELINVAESASDMAFGDLVYRTNLNYRREDNVVQLFHSYGAGTEEPYGLYPTSKDIPLEIEVFQPLDKIFSYNKYQVNAWNPVNKDLNNPRGLYYRLPVLNNSSVTTYLIRKAEVVGSKNIYAGKQFKLKRLSNNKYALRILHYHQKLDWEQLPMMTLLSVSSYFVKNPYIEEYCIQR